MSRIISAALALTLALAVERADARAGQAAAGVPTRPLSRGVWARLRLGMRSALLVAWWFALAGQGAAVAGQTAQTAKYVSSEPGADRFALAADGRAASLLISEQDDPGVIRALHDLRSDVRRVTGVEPALASGGAPAGNRVVVVGTIGKSPLIDRLIGERKLHVDGIAGRWEAFLLQVVDAPLPDVAQALVIAGSDKRGTIYGIYDLSQQIGVSPWHYWADVPVRHQEELYVLPGRHTQGEPAVKYRGIFLNDENPALLGWVNQTFGGFNHRFYETVFELILRLKGNYLWPAMWGKAFNDDDPLNPQLADEYGIVMGTSHHEPLMRAHVEWRRHGTGPWDYAANAETLRQFWTESVRRAGDYENLVTIGMRGDGDAPMTRGTAIDLLERIVRDQRQILHEVAGRDPSSIPQVWALYKEVQDYFEQGMHVPDDVTLLYSDDNWGNLRLLPGLGSRRTGGYGVYYHFDYVGGPRSYKWINTNQIERVWEQMHIAYRYGANRVWVVNVGDLKPMELPIEFFLEYAWDPERWPTERLGEYTRRWAERQFGPKHAAAIAGVLDGYTKLNARRKPELLSPRTYNLHHYREAERVVEEYHRLAAEAERINERLGPEYRDAFYQLVLYPVLASANLTELYVAVAENHLYAEQGRAATNALAERARQLFARDAEHTRRYHEEIAGGKWNHMMSQTHIGYTSWNEPPANVMPEVHEIELPAAAEMGVAVEGSESWWPHDTVQAALPGFDPYQRRDHYVEVFNRGQAAFDYQVDSGAPWVQVTPARGRVEQEARLVVSIDWSHAPTGRRTVPITISGPHGARVVVHALIHNPASPPPDQVTGFVEGNGYVSMEAEHFTRGVDANGVTWQRIPNLGRTLSGMTPFPVTLPAQAPGAGSPRLEYRMHLFDPGEVTVTAYLSPTLSFQGTDGLRYAISFDDEPPQIINMHADGSHRADNGNRAWERMVAENIQRVVSRHRIDRPGEHVLKFWAVDPGVVLQKLVVDTGGTQPSYLGPPESYWRDAHAPEGSHSAKD